MKPNRLQENDTVAIVSLSSGILGEPFIKHELDKGLERLKDFKLQVKIMPNALKGIDYIKEHPESRASDLKEAFQDPNIKAIICAIGGDDTYKTIPYLMEDKEFIEAVKNNPKIFTGFSDSTINHLMLNKLGLNTFYGPNLLVDLAELDKSMLPYTKETFEKFFLNEKTYEIKSSDTWYEDRESYGVEQVDTPRISHKEKHGYETLNGSGIKEGKLYGGCIESLYDAMTGNRHSDEKEIIAKYNILPTKEQWQDKILFIETSEEKITPQNLEIILNYFKEQEILSKVQGIIVGKPIDETYYDEYKKIYIKVFNDLSTPVLYNVNFGHSTPRCLLPYNALTKVDFDNKTITIEEQILN